MKLNKRRTLQESRGSHPDRNRVQQIIQRQLLKALDLNAATDTVRGKRGKGWRAADSTEGKLLKAIIAFSLFCTWVR